MPLMTLVRHEVVHQHLETGVVGRLQQVGHFVDQHVLQAFGRFFARSALRRMSWLRVLRFPFNNKGYHAAGAQRQAHTTYSGTQSVKMWVSRLHGHFPGKIDMGSSVSKAASSLASTHTSGSISGT